MDGQWKNPREEGGGGEASSPQLIKKKCSSQREWTVFSAEW